MPDSQVSDVDVLDVGRRGPSRRTVLLVVVSLLGLLAAGLVIDHKARADEASRLDACATRTHAAIHDATARMAGILNYVRPVWNYQVPRHVRRSLTAMVGETAVGADRPLLRVRRGCAAVTVPVLHSGLRDRRAACMGLLDTYVTFLRGVADDGRRAAGAWPGDHRAGC